MIYPIGTKFLSGGKHKRECVVVDIFRTYNNNGELVKTNYVAEHKFFGQIVRDYDVCAVAIARGLIDETTSDNNPKSFKRVIK